MINTTIDALVDYLKSHCGVNVRFGKFDAEPSMYPLVQIIPQGTGLITGYTSQTNFYEFPLEIRIVDAKDNEIKVLRTFHKFLFEIGGFREYQGHDIGGDFTCEYSQNSTFEIVCLLKIKIDAHKEA